LFVGAASGLERVNRVLGNQILSGIGDAVMVGRFNIGRWAFCLLGAAALVLGRQREIVAQDDAFPIVANYEIFDTTVLPDFKISNDAAFMFEPLVLEIFINSPESPTDILYIGPADTVTAGWSANNRYIAVASTGEDRCTFGAAETYLTLIDMQTTEKNSLCIPLDAQRLDLAWSPFTDTVLFVNETWLLDLEQPTMTRDPGEYESSSGDQIGPAVGYGRYLWNPDTQTPSGVIDLRTAVYSPEPPEPFAPLEPSTITGAWFDHCSLIEGRRTMCHPIMDITTDYPGAFVYDWQINADAMMVWLAVERNSDGPVEARGVHRDQYRDTVLYMTDLSTLETREIFRLSELDMEGMFSNDLDWSPDANTIGLNLSRAIGSNSPGERLLVLHLAW
jgi:hypothetical protein